MLPHENKLLSKAQLTQQAALRSSQTAEKYRFRKKNKIVESSEMVFNYDARNELFKSDTSKWHDRNSLLAMHHGAEMYLQADTHPGIVMGSSRYYFDELSNKEPVDARRKFPYSQEAQYAAKILTQVYRKRLLLRHFSATEVQRSYRGYAQRVILRGILANHAKALLTLLAFFKKCLHKLNRTKQKNKVKYEAARNIQRIVRGRQSRRKVKLKLEVRIVMAILKVQQFCRRQMRIFKRKRGRDRRWRIHATRIQALWRGCLGRRRVNKMKAAKICIVDYYRTYFRRRYLRSIISFQRYYRSYKLLCAVWKIQGFTRMFLTRRFYIKDHKRAIAMERCRFAREQDVLIDVVKQFVEKEAFGRKWWSAIHVPTLKERLRMLEAEEAREQAAYDLSEAIKKAPKDNNQNAEGKKKKGSKKTEEDVVKIVDLSIGNGNCGEGYDNACELPLIESMKDEYAKMKEHCYEILYAVHDVAAEAADEKDSVHSLISDKSEISSNKMTSPPKKTNELNAVKSLSKGNSGSGSRASTPGKKQGKPKKKNKSDRNDATEPPKSPPKNKKSKNKSTNAKASAKTVIPEADVPRISSIEPDANVGNQLRENPEIEVEVDVGAIPKRGVTSAIYEPPSFESRITHAILQAFATRSDQLEIETDPNQEDKVIKPRHVLMDGIGLRYILQMNFLQVKPNETDLYSKVVESISSIFIVNINSLVPLLKPSRALYYKVYITRYIPSYIFAHALYIRYFTYALNSSLYDALTNFRVKNPPRYMCSRCLEPFTFRTMLVCQHCITRPDGSCDHMFNHWSWFRKSLIVHNEELYEALYKLGHRINGLPSCLIQKHDLKLPENYLEARRLEDVTQSAKKKSKKSKKEKKEIEIALDGIENISPAPTKKLKTGSTKDKGTGKDKGKVSKKDKTDKSVKSKKKKKD